jgi:hypothetical protein
LRVSVCFEGVVFLISSQETSGPSKGGRSVTRACKSRSGQKSRKVGSGRLVVQMAKLPPPTFPKSNPLVRASLLPASVFMCAGSTGKRSTLIYQPLFLLSRCCCYFHSILLYLTVSIHPGRHPPCRIAGEFQSLQRKREDCTFLLCNSRLLFPFLFFSISLPDERQLLSLGFAKLVLLICDRSLQASLVAAESPRQRPCPTFRFIIVKLDNSLLSVSGLQSVPLRDLVSSVDSFRRISHRF